MTAVMDAPTASVPVGAENFAVVDASDLALVSAYEWSLLVGYKGKLYAYARGTDGPIYMHRLVDGTPAGRETDHVNGDGLDNRRSNLRTATRSQNHANIAKPRRRDGCPSTSVFKGVYWDRSRGYWMAKIRVNNRSKNLGRFQSEADAARAYDRAAFAAWGTFARLNLPNEVAR